MVSTRAVSLIEAFRSDHNNVLAAKEESEATSVLYTLDPPAQSCHFQSYAPCEGRDVFAWSDISAQERPQPCRMRLREVICFASFGRADLVKRAFTIVY